MSKSLKIILSWVIALFVSAVFMRVVVLAFMGRFDPSYWAYLVLPIAIFSLPLYIIIKKNIFK